jgi:hypothetical protein
LIARGRNGLSRPSQARGGRNGHGLRGPLLVIDAIGAAMACLARWWRRRWPLGVGSPWWRSRS